MPEGRGNLASFALGIRASANGQSTRRGGGAMSSKPVTSESARKVERSVFCGLLSLGLGAMVARVYQLGNDLHAATLYAVLLFMFALGLSWPWLVGFLRPPGDPAERSFERTYQQRKLLASGGLLGLVILVTIVANPGVDTLVRLIWMMVVLMIATAAWWGIKSYSNRLANRLISVLGGAMVVLTTVLSLLSIWLGAVVGWEMPSVSLLLAVTMPLGLILMGLNDRRGWNRASRFGLVTYLCFVLLLVLALMVSWRPDRLFRIAGWMALFGATGFPLLTNDLTPLSSRRWLGLGVVATVCGFLMCITLLETHVTEWWQFVLSSIPISIAILTLIFQIPQGGLAVPLAPISAIAMMTAILLCDLQVLPGRFGMDGTLTQVNAIVLIMGLTSILIQIWGWRLARPAWEETWNQPIRVRLTCPRCNLALSLPVGESGCRRCGLLIQLGIEESAIEPRGGQSGSDVPDDRKSHPPLVISSVIESQD